MCCMDDPSYPYIRVAQHLSRTLVFSYLSLLSPFSLPPLSFLSPSFLLSLSLLSPFSLLSLSPFSLSFLSPSSLLSVSEDADKVLELALKYRPRGVVGVDIAGNELLPLDPIQTQALLAARANGLHLTMHAGESGPPDNVKQVGAIPAVCLLCSIQYTVEPLSKDTPEIRTPR